MSEPQYRLEGIVHTRSEEMEDFEGPLDAIFLLLSKNKIEIQNVSITAILEQYLAYLDEMKRLDMEIASEFITMASHLMVIKTKMLLSAAEQQEAETELDLLRRSLMDRRRKPLRRDQKYRYQHTILDIFHALDTIAQRQGRQLPPPADNFRGIVGKERYPVSRKAGEVLRSLLLRGVERLKTLLRNSRSRSEIVATFLAILDLCKTNSVTLEEDLSGENPKVRLLNRGQPTSEEMT